MRNRIASAVAALAIAAASTTAFAGVPGDRNIQAKGIQVEQAGNGAASGTTEAGADYQFHDSGR